jgi:hypothetical protein
MRYRFLHDDPAASDEQLQQQLGANDRLARTNLDRVSVA